MEPDYSRYSLDELFDVQDRIDSEKYPERFARIKQQILSKQRESVQKVNELFNMEDAGVSFVINKTDEDDFEVKVAITYNFITSYQKNWHSFELSSKKLKYLIECLTEGIESKHGSTSILQANQMIVKRRKVPVKFCEVRMYRRFFILGFNIVPTSISGKIITGLNRIEI
ncbi:hypothetical protein [Aliamphritea ceti]|uniref:hypothetical protein n=1 Tax=Aliamphritea ceti TaxID=1524258 RepID=UPI0021C25EFA|nr:hypothetical protein [Aliamphritea ceti]